MNKDKLGLVTTKDAQVPLVGVDIHAEIVGRGTRVRIAQKFINTEDKPIEAVYKFPLPENSAVCGFKAKIGDKTIQGAIEDKEKAFELYDNALIEGDGGYLMDEERPNIFTLSVGNLNPGIPAIVEIEYVSLLEKNGEDIRFYLPTTISPRYVPPDMPEDDGIPEDEKVNPDFRLDVPYGMKLTVNVSNKEQIRSIESPSHKISTSFEPNSIRTELSGDHTLMDRDFVLNIKYKDNNVSQGYYFNSTEGSYIQIDFSPGSEEHDLPSSQGKEVIFVLDCSGSMQGNSIGEAKRAIEIFIKGLSKDVRFNIYRFGNEFEKLFESSMPYDPDHINSALKYIEKIDADLGGTEVLAPLKDICSNIAKKDIILITDGEVGNEADVLELVRENSRNTRIFVVGIGYGPNDYFVRQVAKTSRGASELIAPGERIEPKVLRLFGKVMSESIQDIKIVMPVASKQTPALPTIFQNETISIFNRLKKDEQVPDKVRLTGLIGSEKREWTVNVASIVLDNSPMPLLWAREAIRDLEEGESSERGSKQTSRKKSQVKDRIIAISREFGIISRETSFVAIERRQESEKTKDSCVLKKVPVMLTKRWGGIDKLQMSFQQIRKVDTLYACPRRISAPPIVSDQQAELKPDESISRKIAGSHPQDIVIELLSLQRPEGGFFANEKAAKMLGFSLKELRSIAGRIETQGETDKLILLFSCIILAVLGKKFMEKSYVWADLVKKSETWLDEETSKVSPIIEGMTLEAWVDGFTEKLVIKKSN